MSIPLHQKALKTDGEGKASVHNNVPIPQLPTGYVLVKVSHVALNPTDWKSISRAKPGFTAGCDLAGTIVEIAPGVTKPLSVGDRVSGMSHGIRLENPESGAFGQYAIAKGDLVTKLSSSISEAEGATYGVGLITTGQGVYQSLGLPQPDQPATEKTALLIYGGSTATGLFAIQLAKLSGLTVVTTCSPKNFDLVKKLGADAAFDYRDPACGSNIRAYTNNSCMHAFDCIAEGNSMEICADALSSAKGIRYSGLLMGNEEKFPRRDDCALCTSTMGYTAGGEAFSRGPVTFPPQPDHFEFARQWTGLCERLSAEGKFRVEPAMREGGLEGIVAGLEDLKQGKVSGQKLVYKVQ